ncbi:sensor histidine kinase [Paenibacillus sp. HB172176]|uniref:sensor histidine kinase n=1 Tax=Paenibacillus sp. HB172176 TaxID=2493690 RepID=UPI00143C7FE8|nr:sensor histidine kinase [Paenibacillus sp. HB172176]
MRKFLPQKMYMPFTYKMLVPYLLLVLLTDVVIGYTSYSMLVDSRTEMAKTNIQTAMQQTKNNIDYQMNEITRITDILFSNMTFQNALQNRGDELQNMLKMRDDVVPQLKGPLQLYGNHLRIALYMANDTMYEIPGDDMSTPISRSDYYVLLLDQIVNRPWFKSIVSQDKDQIWMQIDTDRELGNISYLRKLVSVNASIIGYVRVTARFDELFGNFDAYPIEQGIGVRLVDTSSGQALYERGEFVSSAKKDAFLTVRKPIAQSNYMIETLVPKAYLNKDASRLQRVIGGICAISFLVMAFIGYFVARLSGKKIKRIVTLVGSFQEGNFHKRVGFSGNDEFVLIGNSFNQMATSIQDLIKNVYVQGIQKKQAELDALQAQINPHFLYNTLSTIGSLANLGEVQKVTEMVQGLSRFYRLTINGGEIYIPLEKELEQVQTYLDIQKVKYADSFRVYVDIEPDIRQISVIKLILQPFVENIFKHAWFGDTIAIRITGRRLGDCIELKVIDNGIGMRKEALERMRTQSSQSDSYGLRNVEERISLRYGSDFGIRIGSYFGAGTTVEIILPIEHKGVDEEERADIR